MQIEQQVGGDYQQTAAQVAAGEKPVQITASDIIADGAALVETVAVAAQSPEIYDDFIKQSRQAVVNVVVKQMTTAGVASNGGSAMGMLDSGNLGRFSQMYKRELTLTEKQKSASRLFLTGVTSTRWASALESNKSEKKLERLLAYGTNGTAAR